MGLKHKQIAQRLGVAGSSVAALLAKPSRPCTIVLIPPKRNQLNRLDAKLALLCWSKHSVWGKSATACAGGRFPHVGGLCSSTPRSACVGAGIAGSNHIHSRMPHDRPNFTLPL